MNNDGVLPQELIRESDPENTMIRKDGRTVRPNIRKTAGLDDVTKAQIKAEMASMWREGDTYDEIAGTLNEKFGLEGPYAMNAKSINKGLSALKRYWRTLGALHIDEKQAVLLARLDQLEQICIEAYFASCDDKTTNYYEKQYERARSKDREKAIREGLRQEREERAAKLNGNAGVDRKAKELMYDNLDGIEDALVVTAEKVKEYERRERTVSGDPRWMKLMIEIADKRAKLLQMYNRKAPVEDSTATLSDEQRQERLAAVLNSVLTRRQVEQGQTNLAPATSLGGTRADVSANSELVIVPEEDIEVLGLEVPKAPEVTFDFSDLDPAEIKSQSSVGEEFWD